MKQRDKRLVRRFLPVLLAMFSVPFLLFSVGDGKLIPNWDDFFHYFSLAPELGEEEDFIRFIDVGQGDSILICSNGKTTLIDTGPEDSAGQLCKKLRSCGVKQIDLLLITHIHSDHVGGCEKMLKNFAAGNLVMPNIIGEPEGEEAMVLAQKAVSAGGGSIYTAAQGMVIHTGDFELTILGYFPQMEDENNRSIVLMAEIRGMKFLLMGDAEKKEEARLLEENLDLSCDVLKVGHHGSSTSTGEDFLTACQPEQAVISCGCNNPYMHPHEETLSALDKANVTVYRTDMHGDITLSVSENKYEITTEK